MKPICTMSCEDCGKFLVADEKYISVFVVDEEACAVTRCPHCDQVIFQVVPANLLPNLGERGVKVFNWNTGSLYEFSRD